MDSESCSKLFKKGNKFLVAAIFIAATILLAPRNAMAMTVRAIGLKEWQEPLALQTLTAVAQNIPLSGSARERAQILETVARRLFSGYEITVSEGSGEEFIVSFKPEGGELLWRVEIVVPTLREQTLAWFYADTEGFSEEIEEFLQGVPLESLSWSDRELRDKIDEISKERLPGWEAELLITRGDGEALLGISFAPQMPMILAVNPSVTSTSLPTTLFGEFRNELQGRFAPLVGLPVAWAEKHSSELTSWTEDYINEQMLVKSFNWSVDANFQPSQISTMNVRMDSKSYTISAWTAIYAGTSDKSAELGVHLGRKVEILPELDTEAYVEGIVGMQDWRLDGRFGLRLHPIVPGLWLGGEWDTEDDKFWGRVSFDAQLHKPYAWVRLREDGVFNAAIGWRATENISFEVEYDERDDDRWSLKMIGSL